MRTLCHFKCVTREKASKVKPLTELQNCFTTKDTKGTKNKTQCVVEYDNGLRNVTNLKSGINRFVLRPLRTLRGEFSLAGGRNVFVLSVIDSRRNAEDILLDLLTRPA